MEILTLDRPAKRNVMDWRMVEGIGRTVPEMEADPAVLALVVTGVGSAFSPGWTSTGWPRPPREARRT